jgi:pyridoxamine 5'-phosphate oxidase
MLPSTLVEPDPLLVTDFTAAEDPFALFALWFEEAGHTEVVDPNAMTLATVDSDGRPNARMVLMKGADEAGFVFFTNLESRKAQELEICPHAALVFHWKSLTRQVRVRGPATAVTAAESNNYFASRRRQSQIGAWASRQSAPLSSRSELENSIAHYSAKYVESVPRPEHWGGFRLVPRSIEFWHDRPFRLHDRIEFKRKDPDEPWSKIRLYP